MSMYLRSTYHIQRILIMHLLEICQLFIVDYSQREIMKKE